LLQAWIGLTFLDWNQFALVDARNAMCCLVRINGEATTGSSLIRSRHVLIEARRGIIPGSVVANNLPVPIAVE